MVARRAEGLLDGGERAAPQDWRGGVGAEAGGLELGGVLCAVGGTPLVRLKRLFAGAGFEVYAKLEALNPAGSVKDRTALSILAGALAQGKIRAGTVVVESSSGNLAIGLAQACAYLGLRFICVVDTRTTAQNLAILRAYGVEVDVVTRPDAVSGEFLPARLRRVRTLLARHPDSFWPNQYANPRNPLAHRETMREIVEALDRRVDYLFCAVSTFGTLRGCAEYTRSEGLSTRIIAVDAVGSVIFGGRSSQRLIPGHGAAVRPALFKRELVERVVHVSDLESVIGCRSLVRREALLAGGSSGAVVMGLQRMRAEIPKGARCVLVLPDRGERYLETIYSDRWVRASFGALPEPLPADGAPEAPDSRC